MCDHLEDEVEETIKEEKEDTRTELEKFRDGC